MTAFCLAEERPCRAYKEGSLAISFAPSKMIAKPFKGIIDIDTHISVTEWEPCEQLKAPTGAAQAYSKVGRT